MDDLSPAVTAWCRAHRDGLPCRIEPLTGGSICHVVRLRWADGGSAVLKTHPAPPKGFFTAEAAGLAALAAGPGPRAPGVLGTGADWLMLEDLGSGKPERRYWEEFGTSLAALHARPVQGFGSACDNWLGLNPQPNTATADGHAFYREHRLLFQGRRAFEHGKLEAADWSSLQRLGDRLPILIPVQPPSLLHGDLWSGNIVVTASGGPAVIDPAVYQGWAEADLAMTALFGGFPDRFYDAYQEAHPLAAGWRERFDLHNLYHLLNHLDLFGGSYLTAVRDVLLRFD